MVVDILQGIVRVTEINGLDSGFGSLLDAAQIAENAVSDAAAWVGDFARQAMQAGGDGQIIKHVADLAAAFIVRPMFAVLFQSSVAHCRMIGSVAVEKDVAAL